MNILIVEDEAIIAASIKKILKKIPFVNIVDIATNFNQAFDKISSNVYDLALIDIFLGENQYNGFKLCEIIRKKNKTIPLVIITAYHSIKYIETAFAIGVNDYITKPFNHKEVELRIKRWLMLSHKIKTETQIKYKEICFNPNTNVFFFKNKKMELSKKKKTLLLIFLQKPEKILSGNYLKEKLWGDYVDYNNHRNIRSNIQLLKQSLPPECMDWIQNVRGEGYILQKT